MTHLQCKQEIFFTGKKQCLKYCMHIPICVIAEKYMTKNPVLNAVRHAIKKVVLK